MMVKVMVRMVMVMANNNMKLAFSTFCRECLYYVKFALDNSQINKRIYKKRLSCR